MACQVDEFRPWSAVRKKWVQVSRIYRDGYLYLEGDPEPWIQRNLSHRLSIRSLELCDSEREEIGDSIAELAELTLLYLLDFKSLNCLTNVLRLHNLRGLSINFCEKLEELPENIGELTNLTLLQLYKCKAIKFLPNSIADLSKLSTLIVEDCESLEALPPNMGELINLTLLRLSDCEAIKSLPDSIADLSKLSTLKVKQCESIEALPSNLKVVDLCLYNCCRIKCLPRGLTNLESLNFQLCSLSEEGFSNLTNPKRLRELTISVCSHHPVKEMQPNFIEFFSFETMSTQCPGVKNLPSFAGLPSFNVEKLPINLDELPQLVLLDIQCCHNIKYLAYRLKNLINLKFLRLPSNFRLETLSLDLNDSVIISVHAHIHKNWKELKLDMGPLYIGAQNCSPSFASGYLSLKDDPSTLILAPFSFRSLVRILDLKLRYTVEEIGGVIAALPNLTHLYVSATVHLKCLRLNYLPDTTTRLTHLSLNDCYLAYHCDSMGKLSNLKSLDLCLHETQLPAALDLLFCLEHLTLRYSGFYSLFDNVANLSNLNTLELHHCHQPLPENLNLNKLKLVYSSVESFPTSLCHLEIVHGSNYCFENCKDDFKMCLKQLVNLKTLSLTCYRIKFLPTVVVLKLQKLLLKDCVNLRNLMPNMDELVNLCTLDISGTRIKSLSKCITKLPKLQYLVLPKCFKKKNVPSQFFGNKSIVKIEFDGKDETYYKENGYYHFNSENSMETSDEDNEIASDSVVGRDDTVCRKSGEEGSINVQTPSSRLPKPSEATQCLGDFHICERKLSTGENTHHGSLCSQNQETRVLSSGVCSMAVVDNMNIRLSSNAEGTINFGADRQMGTMSLGKGALAITPSDLLLSFAHDGNNHLAVVDAQNSSNPHGDDKMGNRLRKEITHDEIQTLRDEHMTLIEAAKKLGVSRSTMKRRCKELELGKWPSSKKKKSNCSKKRGSKPNSLPGGKFSQPSLVDCIYPDGSEYADECLDTGQHNLSHQVAPVCDSIDKSTSNATTESVGELHAATHRHMDVHETFLECTVRKDLHPLLCNVLDSSSSSSFDIKATYKEDIVRFKWSSTACLKELKEAVVENLKIEFESFKLKYQDEEEDWVLINTNEHLQRALSYIKNNILRLKVTDL